MRVAALYDIHGNDTALAAVLAEIESLGVDLIVVGGDVAGGPFPRQAVDAVQALGDRAITIRGNGERELVEARLRLDDGTARIDPDDVWSSRTHWAAGVLDQARLDWMAALPPLASAEVDGLGDVLFCHASPRNDEEIVTPLSPASRIAPMLAGVSQSTVVLGHTHVQFDREVGGTPARQRGQRRPALPGQGGRVLGPARPRRRAAQHALRRDGDLRPHPRERHPRSRGVRRGHCAPAGRRRGERVLRAHGHPARLTPPAVRPGHDRVLQPISAFAAAFRTLFGNPLRHCRRTRRGRSCIPCRARPVGAGLLAVTVPLMLWRSRLRTAG